MTEAARGVLAVQVGALPGHGQQPHPLLGLQRAQLLALPEGARRHQGHAGDGALPAAGRVPAARHYLSRKINLVHTVYKSRKKRALIEFFT